MNVRKSSVILLAFTIFATGCQNPLGVSKYEGKHWYEEYQQEAYESIMLQEISKDSMADSWKYGKIVEKGQSLAFDEEYYYCENYLDESKIYRINKKDFSKKEKLTDFAGYDINVIDDKVYFYKADTRDNDMGIYRMNSDGSELTRISSVIPSFMQIVNDWIYYVDAQKSGIYKLHVAGKEPVLLKELSSCRKMVVEGNRIYFIYGEEEEWHIASMNVNGEDFLENSEAGDFWGLVVKEDILYTVRTGKAILKVNSKTLEIEEEYEVSVGRAFDLSGEYLYFVNQDKNDALARMNVTTGEITTTEHTDITGYEIFDDMIITTTVKNAQPLVRVNRLSDGSSVSFFE